MTETKKLKERKTTIEADPGLEHGLRQVQTRGGLSLINRMNSKHPKHEWINNKDLHKFPHTPSEIINQEEKSVRECF